MITMINASVMQSFNALLNQSKWSVYYVESHHDTVITLDHGDDLTFTEALTVICDLSSKNGLINSDDEDPPFVKGPYLAFGKAQHHVDESGVHLFESPIRLSKDQILEAAYLAKHR